MRILVYILLLACLLGFSPELPAELYESREEARVTVSQTYAPPAGAEEPAAQAGAGQGLTKGPGQSSAAAETAGRPVYYDYDPDEFYELCEELCDLAEGRDAQAVIDGYDRLYEEFLIIDSLSSEAYLVYCADVFSEEAAQDRSYIDDLWSETAEALLEACRAVMEGPCADEFEAHVGAEAAAYYRYYRAPDDREWELFERESELVDEYYEALARSESTVYRYAGRDWTAERLYGSAGDELYVQDPDGYFEVYDGLLAQLNEEVGPIFLELVQLRSEIAELYGYESYADYAYENLYGRDYTTADAQAFCDAVKATVSEDYYDDVYYDDRAAFASYRSEAPGAAELLELLGSCLSEISPLAQESWTLMTDKELYDIGSGYGRLDSAFNLSFSAGNLPFIYMNMVGDTSDFFSLTHEMGHYVDAWENPVPNILTDMGDYDLFEVHSNGLAVLCLPWYEQVYGPLAEDVTFAVLGDMLDSVVAGCLYDEFQRRVYAEPDMTLEEVNALYAEVCEEYGEYWGVDEDLYWVYVTHNYDNPLYYISYAASALAALQIWDLSRQDYEAGVALWERFVEAGAYEYSYMELLEAEGLKSFADPGAVEEVCRPVLAYLRELD